MPVSLYRNPEVPIPRLPRAERPPPKTSLRPRDRVQRACRSCHKRKIKCSGNLPRCEYCEKSNRKCVYDNTRKDRLAIATDRNDRLASLLRDLSDRVNDHDKSSIDDVLQDSDAENDESPAPTQFGGLSRIQTFRSSEGQASRSQTPQSSSILSPSIERSSYNFHDETALDYKEQQPDTDQSDRGDAQESAAPDIAFTGHISEVHWLMELRRRVHAGVPALAEAGAVNETGFYLECEGKQLADPGNPFTLPNEMTARVLFECYMRTVQRSFPLLSTNIDRQLLTYYHSIRNGQTVNFPQRWYAVVNLVLAMGARFSRYVSGQWHQAHSDEAIYFSRAHQLLGLNETAVVLAEADPMLIQATGLLAFYYLTTGHVNRAWIMVSTALRFAIALGLHQPHQSPLSSSQEKQAMSGTWWSLHNLENLLCSMIGRPCMLRYEDITVPVPSALITGQTVTSSMDAPYISPADSQVQIAMLSQQILSGLYSERREVRSWVGVHATMALLMSKIEDWKMEAIPPHLQGSDIHFDIERQQLLAKKNYHRLKILVTRPSLRRFEQCYEAGTGNTTAFDRIAAELCIQAAHDVVGLLPEEIDLRTMYEKGPWWALVHNFMQAASVLLTAISLREQFPSLLVISISSFYKLIRWLQAMRGSNDIADRAYGFLHDIVTTAEESIWPEVMDSFPQETFASSASHSHAMGTIIPLITNMYDMPWHG